MTYGDYEDNVEDAYGDENEEPQEQDDILGKSFVFRLLFLFKLVILVLFGTSANLNLHLEYRSLKRFNMN